MTLEDEIATLEGEWIPVDGIVDNGLATPVYNFRVADHHTYFLGDQTWEYRVWVHNSYVRKLVRSADEVPTYASGEFGPWFDSLSARTVKTLFKDNEIRDKITRQLLAGGGQHEMLMRSLAPHWKKWGIKFEDYKKMSISIERLNEGGIAKGWVHSTGLPNSVNTNSGIVHNELADIILESNSLDEFYQNVLPWARKWLRDGGRNLPRALRG